jgi:hypothetical protein
MLPQHNGRQGSPKQTIPADQTAMTRAWLRQWPDMHGRHLVSPVAHTANVAHPADAAHTADVSHTVEHHVVTV